MPPLPSQPLGHPQQVPEEKLNTNSQKSAFGNTVVGKSCKGGNTPGEKKTKQNKPNSKTNNKRNLPKPQEKKKQKPPTNQTKKPPNFLPNTLSFHRIYTYKFRGTQRNFIPTTEHQKQKYSRSNTDTETGDKLQSLVQPLFLKHLY